MDSSVTNAEIGLKEMQQRAILLKKETDAIGAHMAEFISWKHQQQQQQQQQQESQQHELRLPSVHQQRAQHLQDPAAASENERIIRLQVETESASVAFNSPIAAKPHSPFQQLQPPPPLSQPIQGFTNRSYLKSPPLPVRKGACAMSIDWPKHESASWLICRDALLAAAANGWACSPVSKAAGGKDQRDVAPLPMLQLCRLIEDAFEDAFKTEILTTVPCAAAVSTKSFPAILCSAAVRKVGDGSASKSLVVRAVLTAWGMSSSHHDGSSGHQLLTTAAHSLASGHWGSCCMSFLLLLRAMLGPTHVDTRIERLQLMQAVAAVFAGSKWASNAANTVAQCLAEYSAMDDASCHEVMTALLRMFVGGWEAYTETMKECFRKAMGVSSSEGDSNVWLNEEAFCSVIAGMCPSVDESMSVGWWRAMRKMGDGFHSGVPLLTAMMVIDRQKLFMIEIGVAPLGNRVAASASSLAHAAEAQREQEQTHSVQIGSFSPPKMKTAAVLKQRLL